MKNGNEKKEAPRTTRDWDFEGNTRAYLSGLAGESGKAEAPESPLAKLKKVGVIRTALAFFPWLLMELVALALAPFFFVWSLFIKSAVDGEDKKYAEKVLNAALDNFEPASCNSPIDAILFRGYRGCVENRPSVMVAAPPRPE